MKELLQALGIILLVTLMVLAIGVLVLMTGTGTISGIKLARKAPPEPVAYARRIIVEWPDGQIRLVRFALLPNGEMRWMESEPNPDREAVWEAQQRKRRVKAALEAERKAIEEFKRGLPKMKRTETNALEDRPLTWEETKNL